MQLDYVSCHFNHTIQFSELFSLCARQVASALAAPRGRGGPPAPGRALASGARGVRVRLGRVRCPALATGLRSHCGLRKRKTARPLGVFGTIEATLPGKAGEFCFHRKGQALEAVTFYSDILVERLYIHYMDCLTP